MDTPVFYYDINSPYAYLAAMRLDSVIPGPVRWQPIFLGGLFPMVGRTSWAFGPGRDDGIAECERRAAEYGLPPFTWPQVWPYNPLPVLRAAIWADTPEFARAAYTAVFAEGRDVSDVDVVVAVAESVGLDAEETREAIQDPAIKQRLRAATDAAYEAGVIGVPTLGVNGSLFWGDDRLEEAAAAAAA